MAGKFEDREIIDDLGVERRIIKVM